MTTGSRKQFCIITSKVHFLLVISVLSMFMANAFAETLPIPCPENSWGQKSARSSSEWASLSEWVGRGSVTKISANWYEVKFKKSEKGRVPQDTIRIQTGRCFPPAPQKLFNDVRVYGKGSRKNFSIYTYHDLSTWKPTHVRCDLDFRPSEKLKNQNIGHLEIHSDVAVRFSEERREYKHPEGKAHFKIDLLLNQEKENFDFHIIKSDLNDRFPQEIRQTVLLKSLPLTTELKFSDDESHSILAYSWSCLIPMVKQK